MKRISAIFLPLLIAFLYWSPTSVAIRPPPAKIFELKILPDCLKVSPSFLGDQPAQYGTYQKGPAINVTNKCSSTAVINSMTMRELKGDERPIMDVEILFMPLVDGKAQYIGLIFAKTGEHCTIIKKGDGGRKCREISLQTGDSVRFPAYWGNYFNVAGEMSDQSKVSITGWMINPENPAQALDFFLKEAEQGKLEAQLKVGHLFMERANALTQDANASTNAGINWYLKAAENNGVEAYFSLCQAYVARDPQEAIKWCGKAAEQSGKEKIPEHLVKSARCQLALAYVKQEKYSDAAKTLSTQLPIDFPTSLAAARKGDAVHQVAIGHTLRALGDCGWWMKWEAKKWYERAALSGNADGEYHFGSLQRPYEDQIIWYRKAAKQNHAAAQFALGQIYEINRGVNYILLRDKNLPVTAERIEGVELIRRAAGQGNIAAQNYLADLYYQGLVVQQDYEEAYFWSMLAKQNFQKYGATRSSSEVEEAAFWQNRPILGEEELASDRRQAVKKRLEKWQPSSGAAKP